MTRRSHRFVICCAIVLGVSVVARGQIMMQPTRPPIATAENESWYVNGEPITHEGNFYYPAGSQVHFSANEMVRTGFYRGIGIYARTTLEPFSVVFVPLPGGLMQPYERRRAGDVAGTAGSTTPLLPIEIAAEDRSGTPSVGVIQAASPPTNVGPNVSLFTYDEAAQPRATALTETVGTFSRHTPRPAFPPVRIGEQPSGINAIFIEFQNAHWYSRGGAMPFDAAQFQRIGEHRGFPVYARAGRKDVIYIPTTTDTGGLVVPYSTKRVR